MPTGCSVPQCRGNYRSGPKVKVFGFPKDLELKKKWINAIRMDGEPSDYSKVCELHFLVHEIRAETTATDPDTGKQITIKLDRPRLTPGALPSQFPDLPASLSATQTALRKSMEERLTENENEQMWRAVEESRAAFEEEKTMDSCTSYEEFISKLEVGGDWIVIHRPDESQIIHFSEISTTPQIKCSVTVDRTLTVSASLEGVKLFRIKDFEMPMKMDTISRLDEILLELLKLVTSQKVTATDRILSRMPNSRP